MSPEQTAVVAILAGAVFMVYVILLKTQERIDAIESTCRNLEHRVRQLEED